MSDTPPPSSAEAALAEALAALKEARDEYANGHSASTSLFAAQERLGVTAERHLPAVLALLAAARDRIEKLKADEKAVAAYGYACQMMLERIRDALCGEAKSLPAHHREAAPSTAVTLFDPIMDRLKVLLDQARKGEGNES